MDLLDLITAASAAALVIAALMYRLWSLTVKSAN